MAKLLAMDADTLDAMALMLRNYTRLVSSDVENTRVFLTAAKQLQDRAAGLRRKRRQAVTTRLLDMRI